jgi:hypothetical protein
MEGRRMTPTIRTLAPGEQITEPGFYNISLDVHHNQPCDGPSVTSGILRTIEHGTPADVWAFHALNPDRWEKPETDALRLGRAMAAYIEGGMEAVGKEYLILPADKPRRPTAQQAAAYDEGRATEAGAISVEFWSAIEADGRTPLTDEEITMIANMGKAFDLDPAAAAIMGGIPEVTMAWRDDETGLWCLARPDTINFDGTVTDYKKVSSQGRPFNHRLIDRRITEHGYHMQLAFAGEGMEALGIGWPQLAVIVAQSDKPPHHIIARVINEEALRLGQFQNRQALRTFAECLASGHWPGPGEDIGEYQMPEFEKERIADRMTWKPEGEAE